MNLTAVIIGGLIQIEHGTLEGRFYQELQNQLFDRTLQLHLMKQNWRQWTSKYVGHISVKLARENEAMDVVYSDPVNVFKMMMSLLHWEHWSFILNHAQNLLKV